MLALALTASLLAASPDAGTPARPASRDVGSKAGSKAIVVPVDVPGMIDQIEVPETLSAMGVPVKLRAIRSREKVDALSRHFRKAWEKAGLYVPDDLEIENPGPLPHVTGIDVEAGVSYSVLFQTNLDGTTTVILGEAALHASQPKGSDVFAPVFPGSSQPLVMQMESGRSLTYSARGTPEELAKFYAQTLGAAGWKETEPLVFQRPGSVMRVWLKPRQSEETGVVVLLSNTGAAH